MSLCKVFELVIVFWVIDVKMLVVLMGYVNLIEVMGLEKFVSVVLVVGVDGVLVVDYLLEEVVSFGVVMKVQGMDLIFLFVLMFIVVCIEQVVVVVSGYVYYVLLVGVIGVGYLNIEVVVEWLLLIWEKIGLLVGVGFGIWDVLIVVCIVWIVDVVVVGSWIIEEIEKLMVEIVCVNVKVLVVDICCGVDEVKL